MDTTGRSGRSMSTVRSILFACEPVSSPQNPSHYSPLSRCSVPDCLPLAGLRLSLALFHISFLQHNLASSSVVLPTTPCVCGPCSRANVCSSGSSPQLSSGSHSTKTTIRSSVSPSSVWVSRVRCGYSTSTGTETAHPVSSLPAFCYLLRLRNGRRVNKSGHRRE